MPKVTVLPANLSIDVPGGELLIKAGTKAGVEMEGGCFRGICGTCVVQVLEGMQFLSQPSARELDVLDEWNKDPDSFRLACCTKVKGPGDVVIRGGHD